jgi:hypothetical protein
MKKFDFRLVVAVLILLQTVSAQDHEKLDEWVVKIDGDPTKAVEFGEAHRLQLIGQVT